MLIDAIIIPVNFEMKIKFFSSTKNKIKMKMAHQTFEVM